MKEKFSTCGAGFPALQEAHDFRRREGAAYEVALDQVAAYMAQEVHLRGGLDPLGHYPQAERVGLPVRPV